MTRKLTFCGLLASVAIVISSLERFIPLQAVIPLPGIKLGLSNCIILFILMKYDFKYAFTVMLCKCIVVSVLFSGAMSFLYSFTGGLLALTGMYILLKFPSCFSVYGISVAGAALHNTGQIAAASLVLVSTQIFKYLPLLLLTSLFTGLVTGIITDILNKHLQKV